MGACAACCLQVALGTLSHLGGVPGWPREDRARGTARPWVANGSDEEMRRKLEYRGSGNGQYSKNLFFGGNANFSYFAEKKHVPRLPEGHRFANMLHSMIQEESGGDIRT